jgi:hypothetical protein
MTRDNNLRQPTPQPDMRPAKLPSSTRRFEQGTHDTPKGPLHGARGEDSNPNYDPGYKGKQQKKRKQWPY